MGLEAAHCARKGLLSASAKELDPTSNGRRSGARVTSALLLHYYGTA